MSDYQAIQPSFNFDPEPSPPLMSISEIFDTAYVDLLVATKKENSQIEWKPAGVHTESLGAYFSMWANTAPDGGLLVIGISNDGSVSGCVRTEQEHLNNIEKAGYTFCPEARFECKKVPARRADGSEDYLLLFRIRHSQTGRVVRTNKGEAYTRIGDSKRKLTEDEIRELEIFRGVIDFEMDPMDYQYPKEFDKDLIRQFIAGFRLSRNGQIGEDVSDEEILEMRHLGMYRAGTFHPNVACVLAFATDPTRSFPGCKIRFLRFEGEIEGSGERWNPVKDVFIDEGPIPRQIVLAEQIIDSQMRVFTRLEPNGKFESAPEYPKVAWYEALVNACVHRSYNLKNSNIFR
jgi:ATP-dependent DNA helicase RecG